MFWRGEKGGGNMAKKPTEKQLYKLKNEWLGQFFEEVKPKEFYRAVFPEGSFERKVSMRMENITSLIFDPEGAQPPFPRPHWNRQGFMP